MFQSNHFNQPHFNQEHWVDAGSGGLLFAIDGVGRLDYLQPSSLNIQQQMNNRSTADFIIVGINGYKPLIGEEIIIESSPCSGEPFKRIFGGHIRDIQSSNPRCDTTVFHQVTCVDYNALLDKRLVFQIYQAQPVQDVIEAIHEDFLSGEGITLGNVDAKNLKLEKAVFSYVKVSKAFNDISTNTGLFWYIDYFRDLHFFLRSKQSTTATLQPECSNANTENKEFCAFINNQTCNMGIRHGKITVSKRSDQVVNEQFVIAGNDETKLRQELFFGDGKRQSFSLKYGVSTVKLNLDQTIAVDAIRVDAVDQTVGYRDDNTDGEPQGFQWYFEKGSFEIVQDDAGTPLTSGQTLEVNYKGLFNIVVKNDNVSPTIQQYAERENTSGLYQNVEDDESIESRAFAQQMANGLVRKFEYAPVSIEFVSDIKVIDIGDIISVKLSDHDIDAPNGFMVNAINIQEIENHLMRYTYELLSTENQGDWQEYFRKIEFFGRQLKLREQQKLIVAEGFQGDIVVGQTFTYSEGSGDLQTQDQNYERCFCHIGRAFHSHNLHCIPEVVRLGLV